MRKIKFIHVGLGSYSFQRLEILKKNKNFQLVGIVDKNREHLKKLNKLEKKIFFRSISLAKKKVDAEACFIYVSANQHAKLVTESLKNNLHTFCVKPLALNSKEFKSIIKLKKKNKLVLVQGQNNQWNDASLEMQRITNNKKLFGKFNLGYCIIWGRQVLLSKNARVDTKIDGSFFHSMACHQLGQLVACLGLPKSVYCKSSPGGLKSIGYNKTSRTGSGNIIFDYGNGKYFNYVGNRTGHGNPKGFAARWSGEWMFGGSKGDLRRSGGRITFFSDGMIKKDTYLQDVDDFQKLDDARQYENFYDALKLKKNYIEKQSLDTWILMEACNISSREKKIVNINSLRKFLGLNK